MVDLFTDGKVRTFTVIGMYMDNKQRFAEWVNARTPKEAERFALEGKPEDLLIAGVVLGKQDVVG